MKFYAIYDLQTNSLLESGKNCKTIKEVTEEYISYKSVDTDVDWLKKEIKQKGLKAVLNDDEFTLLTEITEF